MESTWTSIPYGRGLRNQPVYVLNAQLEECPVGVEGEICIGGMGLAQGYLNDAEKTAASFVWREASGEQRVVSEFTALGIAGATLLTGKSPFWGATIPK